MKVFSRALHQIAIPWTGVVLCALILPACAKTEDTRVGDTPPPADAKKEISPVVQQKLDSHLIMGLKKSRGEPPFDRPTLFDPDLPVDAEGKVTVDLTAKVTPGLLEQIRSSGGEVISHFEAMNAVRARVPLVQVETLAALPEVRFISPAARATTNAPAAAAGGNLSPPDSSTSTPPAKHEN
ncbi:hypothetical protein [Brevifollis gellanilyticus]|nr:hypothetical protein [Brevifollis gellanilyticus]